MTDRDLQELADLSRVEFIQTVFNFDPFDYQAELITYGEDNEVAKAAVKPGRQVGKTVTGGAIAAERALSGHDVMILGPFEDTVKQMREASQSFLRTAGERLPELPTTQENKTDWRFANGGRLRSRTVGREGTQIRGENPDVVLVDEAAYIKDSIYTEVIPSFFATHSPPEGDGYEYYLFSTPAGKSGFFYKKVADDDTFYSPHWPSSICPLISDDWIAEKRQELDSHTFQQEIQGEFLEKGDTLFSVEEINAIKGNPELGDTRYLGVDVARKGKDRTAYTEIDSKGHVRVVDSEETSTMDGVLGRIRHLHKQHNYDTIVIEENSMGGGVVDFGDDLQRIIQPFTSTTKSQHKLYKSLQKAIESEEITIPDHRRLFDELTSLQFDYTQHSRMKVSHPEGGHDDFADSLAFAYWGSQNQTKIIRKSGQATKSEHYG